MDKANNINCSLSGETNKQLIENKLLQKALIKIRLVYITLLICGFSTIFYMISNGITTKDIIISSISFGLAFGVYKKSRVCAIAIFLIVIFGAMLFVIDLIKGSSNYLTILLPILFSYLIYQGVSGTLSYHKIKHTKTM